MIIMARILTPSDYGLVGMVVIFISVSQSLIDSGFSQALIRKQDRSEIDNSTVFYFNIVVGVSLYFLLYFCSPLIAKFYKEPQLIPITRVIGLSIIFNSLVVVQRALLTIKIDFKTQAKASLIAASLSGCLGIFLAYHEYGVWAIVTQQVTNLLIITLLLWIFSRWRPRLVFSWQSFKELFSFGSKLLASGLLDTLYRNIYLIIIGKIFKASDLGYYTRANQFSDFVSSNITGIFQRVSYPVLCTIQKNDNHLANVYRRMLRTSAYIIFPLLMLLSAISKPLVITILTYKWSYCSTLLIPLCFQAMWYPIHAINLNLLQVKGRSDLFLRLEILKKIVGIIILCLTIPFGLLVMCWGGLVSSIAALIINTFYTGKLIKLGFWKQMQDLMPILLVSLFMGIIVYFSLNFIEVAPWGKVIIGISEGILIYISITNFFKFAEFNDLKAIFQKKGNC